MLITRKLVRKAIARHAEAAAEDSWKGGGDPADGPVIEAELKAAQEHLEMLVCLLIPGRGLNVERTQL